MAFCPRRAPSTFHVRVRRTPDLSSNYYRSRGSRYIGNTRSLRHTRALLITHSRRVCNIGRGTGHDVVLNTRVRHNATRRGAESSAESTRLSDGVEIVGREPGFDVFKIGKGKRVFRPFAFYRYCALPSHKSALDDVTRTQWSATRTSEAYLGLLFFFFWRCRPNTFMYALINDCCTVLNVYQKNNGRYL